DHRSSQARMQGLEALHARVRADQAVKPLPLFVTGDFNLTPDEETYGKIAPLEDLTSAVPGTYHNFGALKCPKKIDYILRDPATTPGTFACEAWHAGADGRCLSDHDAVALTWTR
ncbi:MAG TPA: endonuclease/exonuclease/phosphatase family protein, partial [Clostridia bacterium]|nr:endonuclease/exonuclease/phosphatase family protein [Clostridia bacterium]